MRKVLLSCLAVAVLAAAPASAGAQAIVSPHIGAAAAGDAPQSRFTWGGGIGVMAGVIGFEIDVSHTPEFFGGRNLLGSNSVTTVMGNLMVGPAFAAVTPYVTAGAGLLRTRMGGAAVIDGNDLGINLGAGLLAPLRGPVALRADVRYFRNVSGGRQDPPTDFDLGGFDYWRLSTGVAFRF